MLSPTSRSPVLIFSASTSRHGALDHAAILDDNAFGWPARASVGAAHRGLSGTGRTQSLRNFSSGRWPHIEVAARQRRGTAMGQKARQPVFDAAACCISTVASAQRHAGSRSEDRGHRAEDGQRVRAAHPHPQRFVVAVLGTRRILRRAHPAAQGIRCASAGTLSAHGVSRPLSRTTYPDSAPRRRMRI